MAIATAAKQIIVDRMDIVVAGGVESISLVQTDALRVDEDPELVALHGDAYIAMIDTAENVARRYGVSRAARKWLAIVAAKMPPMMGHGRLNRVDRKSTRLNSSH